MTPIHDVQVDHGAPRPTLPSIPGVLVILSAFWIPWGSGIQSALPFETSKIFAAAAILAIIACTATLRLHEQLYPKLLFLWLLFVAAHTLVAYGLFHPNELEWSILNSTTMADGAVRHQEGVGLRLARFTLLAAYGAAVAKAAQKRQTLLMLLCAYLCGLYAAVILGRYFLQTDQGAVARLAGGFLDPNAFALAAAVGLFAALHVAATARDIMPRIIAWIGVPFAALSVLASGSRSGLLAVIFGTFVYFLRSKANRRLATLIAALAVMGCAIAIALPDFILEIVRSRFALSNVIADRGASRPELWASYLRAPLSSLSLGVGMFRSPTLLEQTWLQPRMPHNILIQTLAEQGIVGVTLFVAAIAELFRRLWRLPRTEPPALFAMLAVWICVSMFFDTLNERETWFVLGLCSAAVSKSGGTRDPI